MSADEMKFVKLATKNSVRHSRKSSQLRNKELTWYDEDVPVFVTIVGSMATSTVSDGETWCEFADLLQTNKKQNN